jgi:hypothetical protein
MRTTPNSYWGVETPGAVPCPASDNRRPSVLPFALPPKLRRWSIQFVMKEGRGGGGDLRG